MEGHEVLLSIVILDIRNHYLIPITLESVFHQTDQRFDLTVVVQNILPKELSNLRRITNKLKIIEVPPEMEFSEIKNITLEKVKGKYVHFLFPGEYYLSNISLKYAFEKIERKHFPDLVCFSYIRRDFLSPPKVVPASLMKSLHGIEHYPFLSKDVFFLKKAVLEVKGFDSRYRGLEGFDVILKIYQEEKSRILCCRRVLIDFELQKFHPRKNLEYVSDLILIIYRHYGFSGLFRWKVIKEMGYFMKFWLKGIKRYFMQGEI